MMDKRISGVELPNAIRVKFATVSFQMVTVTMRAGSVGCRTRFFWDVIFSIPAMKVSEEIATPRNSHPMKIMYRNARTPCDRSSYSVSEKGRKTPGGGT